MSTPKRETRSYLDPAEVEDVGATFDDAGFQGGAGYDPTLDDADVTGMPDPFPGRGDSVPEGDAEEPYEALPDDEPEGDGVTDTPLTWEYEGIAVHDDLARRLGELVVDFRAWADDEDTAEAADLADALEDVYERFGAPSEETDS